ncbi:SPFH domain-containing protein, partial [Rhodococcus yananensis]|uniref:SPFH domain-containing protein n=1 Tax=Rhodococcus yananensis TaxID=2879464 RepID=UPI003EB70216
MIAAVIVAVLVVYLLASVRIIKEYERGVAFRVGRLRAPLGPGVVAVLPGLDKLVRVDLRVVTLTIPPQEVITSDNV